MCATRTTVLICSNGSDKHNFFFPFCKSSKNIYIVDFVKVYCFWSSGEKNNFLWGRNTTLFVRGGFGRRTGWQDVLISEVSQNSELNEPCVAIIFHIIIYWVESCRMSEPQATENQSQDSTDRYACVYPIYFPTRYWPSAHFILSTLFAVIDRISGRKECE